MSEERTLRTIGFIFGIILGIAVCATPVSATLVIADFNDLTGGTLESQAGGTGLTSNWVGAVFLGVSSSDLTVPAGLGYALTQSSGTAQSITADDTTNVRATHRVLTTPLTNNTIWISYLMQDDDDSRSGLAFNGGTGIRLFTLSKDGLLYIDSGSSSTFTDSGIANDVAALILCKITVDDAGGNELWEVWVNPDVSNGPSGLGAPTHVNGNANSWDAGGLHTIGIYGMSVAQVDMLYMSDGPDAFSDVTGITDYTIYSTVIVDFNDLNTGLLKGKAGGTGLTGTWQDNTHVLVTDNDLTAPAGTGYALTQEGNPRSVWGDYTAWRGITRAVTEPFTNNTVWFSFLANAVSGTNTTVGAYFNRSNWEDAGPRVQLNNLDLRVHGNIVAADVFTAGQTALVLCKIEVSDGGNDVWKIWIDPDVSMGPNELGTPTAAVLVNNIGAGGISRIGIGGAQIGDQSNLDMFYMSDGPDAFSFVTGVTDYIIYSKVIADFNDLNAAPISGQAGGAGLSSIWAGASEVDVVAGDLTAPAGTGYALTQSGTAQRAQINHSDPRNAFRTLITPLTGDTIWFSYLMQNPTTDNARIGITFNSPHFKDDVGHRLFAYNQDHGADGHHLFLDGSSHAKNLWADDQGTVLILGKITVDDTGDDTWEIWADPKVSTGKAGLGAAAITKTGAYFNADGVKEIGVYGAKNGFIDMLYMSDGPDGFADVTGYEPLGGSLLIIR